MLYRIAHRVSSVCFSVPNGLSCRALLFILFKTVICEYHNRGERCSPLFAFAPHLFQNKAGGTIHGAETLCD